jgi:cytosine/adenosine deaminase-related metal-dependent hydrolase
LPHLNPTKNLLLVHNTFTKKEDIVWAEKFHQELYWCLCPNANLYIENIVPKLSDFLSQNCKMVIGTDSLASNHSLSIVNEMNTLLRNFNWVKMADILKWATYNGAESLGIQDKFGGFIKGKNSGLNHLSYTPDKLVLTAKLA